MRTLGCAFWDNQADALNLFRNGGFGTLDEFCKLAGGSQFQNEINGLRGLVRAALGLFNPEENFEKSEYYGFVQSVFRDDQLSLREDVAVLTYNYDTYLQFLLYRALEQRRKVSRRGKSPIVTNEDLVEARKHGEVLNAVTSGFYSVGDRSWLGDENSEPSFCVLNLHGAIGGPVDPVSDYESLFSAGARQRAEKLFGAEAQRVLTPIFFPWEIMSDRGMIHKATSLFHGVWERARREVKGADKISFVGLSMHSYLLDGLKYLFEGKEGTVEVVVANTENTAFIPGKTETHWENIPHSPAYAVGQILSKYAPKMKRVGIPAGRQRSDGDITLVQDFASFVKTQMKPVSL